MFQGVISQCNFILSQLSTKNDFHLEFNSHLVTGLREIMFIVWGVLQEQAEEGWLLALLLKCVLSEMSENLFNEEFYNIGYLLCLPLEHVSCRMM